MPDFIPSRVSELKSVHATHKTRGCTNLMRCKVKDLFLEHYMFATIFEVNFLNYTTAASDLQCKLTQKMKIWGGRKERNIQIDKKTRNFKTKLENFKTKPNNTTVGVNKVTEVIGSFPSNLNTFWKSLNILYLSYLDGWISTTIYMYKTGNVHVVEQQMSKLEIRTKVTKLTWIRPNFRTSSIALKVTRHDFWKKKQNISVCRHFLGGGSTFSRFQNFMQTVSKTSATERNTTWNN